MAYIEASSIINDRTLNIFTDASISKLPNTNIVTGGAGANFYIGDTFICSDIKVLFNTTNNQSEITSILLGIMGAIQMRNSVDTINLFSDSRISVYGLREWIFSWINSVQDGIMYSSSGLPVANQKIILSIIDAITRNDLNINIFHIRGHLDSGKDKDTIQFKKSFLKENGLDPYTMIDDEVLQFLIFGNSQIDHYTRSKLYDEQYMQIASQYGLTMQQPFNLDQSYYLANLDVDKYKKCIGVN